MRSNLLHRLLLRIAVPAVVLLLAFVFQAGLVAFCLYAFLILLAVSWLMATLWLQPLRVEREVSDELVHIGDLVKVVTKIRNASPWPILWLYVEEMLPDKVIPDGTTRRLVFIPPGRAFFLHYAIRPTRRGCHQLGPLVLESGDVFGLFRRCRIDRRRDFVTVLPNYQVIEEFQVGQRRMLGDLAAARSLFEDPASVRGIREYRRGDPLKRIHWKSTARTGTLHTKIFDPVIEAGATVALDFHVDSWKRFVEPDPAKPASEVAVEVVCTICRYLADGGWKVGFLSNARDPLGLPGVTLAQARATDSLSEALQAARLGCPDDRLEPIFIPPRASSDQFPIIYENLGRIALTDGLPFEEILRSELAHLERHLALVVVTGGVTDAFISGLLRARSLGYRIMVFVVRNYDAHDRAFEALVPHGIEVFNMDDEWRLKEIATGRRAY